MCTAVTFKTKDHYFGRNLDLEYHYQETVTITPRNYPISFRKSDPLKKHYAIIGMATIADGYPLYYDATNEMGLSMAALNFPQYAVYSTCKEYKDNITPFEFIPWILGNCRNIHDALNLMCNLNLVNIRFNDSFPLTPLHWIIADKKEAITIESLADGLKIYKNPIGVLTNNPPFDYHIVNLTNYLNLTREEPLNRFSSQLGLAPYSRGMGAIGLPGDLSSSSRFVRAAFTKFNSVCQEDENASISQFFHILGSVTQQSGCVRVGDGFEKTIYSSCCNTDRGIYYYKTYENSQITAINMHNEDLNGTEIIDFPLINDQKINYINISCSG